MLAVHNESGALFRYRFGDAEFDEVRFELRVDGERVEIQPKPLGLLAMLLRTPGEVVTSEEILQSVWKYSNAGDLETNVIGTALTKLRGALGKDARRIINLPRVGYRFEGRVERTAVGRAPGSGLALEPGMEVPLRHNFILHELLNRSNYSEVWRAQQTRTGEVRIYKFSPAGDRLAVLKREATLYRLLRDSLGERPDIVRVIDWNFSEAPFFLECEDGGHNLRAWAAEGTRLPSLDAQQRLALFLQIADAVAAAHSVGVLHKDLKPDNVLIAPQGETWQVKLTDFGSGQLLEPARLAQLGITRMGFTATQGLVGDATTGTLLYMAPELARGEMPTVRSDVYALGLLLYQLVIGDMRRPLAPGWQREVADELLQQDIAAATDGNPAHRLASVAELASRLRRIDQRHAELARQRALEQAALQAQAVLQRSRARRPWLVGSLASLALGLLASTVLYLDSRHAYLAAAEQRTRAEAINKFLTDDLIGAADPSAPGAEHDPTVKTLLARAAGRLEGRFADDPATKASVDLAIGQAYFGLSDFADAVAFDKRGVLRLEQAKGAQDAEVLEAEYSLARALAQEDHLEEAGQVLARADLAAGARLDQPSPLSLHAAWCRGGVFLKQMQPAQALPYFEKAERFRLRLLPDDAPWLFRIRGNLAWCYVRLGRDSEAITALGELIQAQYPLSRIGALDWTKVRLEYAMALANQSRYDEAQATLKDSLGQVQQLMGEDHYLTGLIWNHLGSVCQEAGKWDEAIAAQGRAYAIERHGFGDLAPVTLSSGSELAIVTYLGGHLGEALPMLQAFHTALAQKLGVDAPFTQDAAFYLASALNDQGQAGEAEALLPPLQAYALNSVDPSPDWDQRIAGLRGRILMREDHAAQGMPLVAEAVAKLTQDKAPAWMLAPLKASLQTGEKKKGA